MAMKPQHCEAIRVGKGGGGVSRLSIKEARLTAEKIVHNAVEKAIAAHRPRATATASQPPTVEGVLLGRLLQAHMAGGRICQNPTIQAQSQPMQMAAYFEAIAMECSAIAAQLVNPE
ncbi:MAG: hypothetical protein O2890_14860 [Cyanobacteria bacterium]|nr:hypothetical protein [Cyanobacteriota bacterium]